MALHSYELICKVAIGGSKYRDGQRVLVKVRIEGSIPHVITLRDGSVARVEKVK